MTTTSQARLRQAVLQGNLADIPELLNEYKVGLKFNSNSTRTGRLGSTLKQEDGLFFILEIVLELFVLAALSRQFEAVAYFAANHLSYNPRIGWPLAAVARLEIAIAGASSLDSKAQAALEDAIKYLEQCEVKRRESFPTLWQHIQTEEPT